jgi:hypothetical protein
LNTVKVCLFYFHLEIESIFPEDYKLSKETWQDITYLSFPDSNTLNTVGSTVYTFTFKDTNSQAYFGYTYFRQQRDSSIERGFLQKSVVLVSKDPFISLFCDSVKQIGQKYFNAHDSDKTFDFSVPFKIMSDWKISQDATHQLKLYDKITYRSPAPFSNIDLIKNKRYSKHDEVSLKERLSGRRFPYQEVNINSIFENMEILFRIWELMIIGDSILLYTPTPEMCSNAVMICASLISPIPFHGDLNPYFTVHNHEFKKFSSYGETIGFQTQILIGFTNPFFLKSFDKWPHLVCIADPRAKPKTLSPMQKLNFFLNKPQLVQSSPDSRKNLLWEHQEMIWTKRDFVIKYDSNLEKKNLSLKDKTLTETVNNENIKKYFEDLTEDFLDPLEKCFDKLWMGMTSFILKSDHTRVFKPEKFYSFICSTGFKEKIFSGTKSDIEEFYKKFIFSINFQSWLNIKIKEAYYNDIVHTDISQLIKNATEIGLIDLYLRLTEELKNESKTDANPVILKKITEFLDAITKALPENLRDSLLRNQE